MTENEAKRIIKSEMCKKCGVYLGGGECDKDCRVIQCIESLSNQRKEEPCRDAISRADMLDAVGHGTTYTSEEVQNIVNSLPPATPPQKIGHWIDGDDKCPCCGKSKFEGLDADIWADWQPKFCPNCGTKMLPTGSDCNSCEHQNEVDGSNCYECVKGIHNNYKADSENEDKEYEKDLNKLKEQILKEGDTLVFKRDLLERFVEVDNEFEHRPWNLLQICNNFNILIGEKPRADVISRQAVKEFIEYIQTIKDKHNDEGLPINYGTICGIVIRGWKLVESER